MKVVIPVQFDTHNSYVDGIEVSLRKFNEYIQIDISGTDRTITINYKDLLKAIKVLED